MLCSPLKRACRIRVERSPKQMVGANTDVSAAASFAATPMPPRHSHGLLAEQQIIAEMSDSWRVNPTGAIRGRSAPTWAALP